MKFLQWFRAGSDKTTPRLKRIFIAAAAGQPMQAVGSVHAVRDRGLQHDRYHDDNGHWKATDACQVTLISEQELRHARKRTTLNLDEGAHRRNLVVDGITVRDLQHKQFRIGEAVFAYYKHRPPCGYIDRIEGNGLGRALGKGSGVCLKVIESGDIHTGDPIVILSDNDQP